MTWLVFSYSLSGLTSSARVAVWRKLRRLGAIAPKAGVYVLPDKEECRESFQWLAQEVQQSKGEAVVMRVNKFEGLSDTQLVKFFQEARRDDYRALDLELDNVKAIRYSPIKDTLKKIRSQFSDINQIDFFNSPYALTLHARMNKIEKDLSAPVQASLQIPKASLKQYKNKRWVTRPHPHVDRLACAWLIRRFIDLKAVIRYADVAKSDEIAFDMKGVAFGHHGDFCSFETMVYAFNFKDPALKILSEIVHAIDLKDGRYVHPEVEGIAAVLNGWRLAHFSDRELESHGISLFEALYKNLHKKE